METSDKKIDISVIIPARNEAKRLPGFLPVVIDFARKSKYSYEIIVMDDGSTDKTSDVVSAYMKECLFLSVIREDVNKGKGFSVKQGFLASRGEFCLFLDADGSTQPDEIEKNLHYLFEGYDIVIGSRVIASKEVTRKKKFIRKAVGWVFNFLVHSLLFKEFGDTQCGFKMFRKEVVEPVFSKMHINRFGFDMEILYAATKLGYKIKEVPVNWRHVKGSKVNIINDSIKMFINILQIKYWYRK